MSDEIWVVSPIDGNIVARRSLADGAAIAATLDAARASFAVL